MISNFETISVEKGSYCLIFYLDHKIDISIGKFGGFKLLPGFYYYFGSAKGPGGLKARISRHIKIVKKNFWHIDYLRSDLSFLSALYTNDLDRECDWNQKLSLLLKFSHPIPRFGASDCRSGCKSHLVYSKVNMQEEIVNHLTSHPIPSPIKFYQFKED